MRSTTATEHSASIVRSDRKNLEGGAPQRRRMRSSSLFSVAMVAMAVVSHTYGLSLPTSTTTTSKATTTTGRKVDFFSPTLPSAAATPTSSSLLDGLCSDEETEQRVQQQKDNFELHVGRALDTLRRDYPDILTEHPDYSIYDPHLHVVDPSGVRVSGLRSYKNAFLFLHALVRVIYCPEKSSLTFKMCFDKARQAIRISWNAQVVPREIFGGTRTTLYVDGISVYEMSRDTGNITEHRIEHLLINNRAVMPEEGVIAALQEQCIGTVPSLIATTDGAAPRLPMKNTVVEFTPQPPLWKSMSPFQQQQQQPSSLFAMEANADRSEAASTSGAPENMDWDAFEQKNKSRQKFGMKPLSVQEFVDLQAEVQQMVDTQQRQRAADAAAAEKNQAAPSGGGGFLEKMFGQVLEDTCESNFDCERPEICCDFGFKKMCCASGTPVGMADLAMVPVPVDVGDAQLDGRGGNVPPPPRF